MSLEQPWVRPSCLPKDESISADGCSHHLPPRTRPISAGRDLTSFCAIPKEPGLASVLGFVFPSIFLVHYYPSVCVDEWGHELASSESRALLGAGLSHGKNTLSLKDTKR